MSNYTGRSVAILSDIHGLLEPLEAVLEDIKLRDIEEIYTLGDNIGVGPNPSEVLDKLKEYNVIPLSGNSEDYINLGIEPFRSYFSGVKYNSHLWTLSKLNERQIGEIKLYPHSVELLIGGKKVGLCHFANDCRFDFNERSTWTYQNSMEYGGSGYQQFLYTNSDEQKEEIERIISIYGEDSPVMKGYLSALKEPLFGGQRLDKFDAIIQGHVHFKMYESSPTTDYYTIRAVGIGYKKEPIDVASYVILKEKSNNEGFDIEEVLVKFDREKMESNIINSNMPDKYQIERFTKMR